MNLNSKQIIINRLKSDRFTLKYGSEQIKKSMCTSVFYPQEWIKMVTAYRWWSLTWLKAKYSYTSLSFNLPIVALTREGASLTWLLVSLVTSVTTVACHKERRGQLYEETAIMMWRHIGIWVQDPERKKDCTARMYSTHCIRHVCTVRTVYGTYVQ